MKTPEEIVDEQCAALEDQYLKPDKIRLYVSEGSPDKYITSRDWSIYPTREQQKDLEEKTRRKELRDQAQNLLHDARMCNPAHLSHGINSGISTLEWSLKTIEEGRGMDAAFYQRLNDNCIKLAGFLYLLKYSK